MSMQLSTCVLVYYMVKFKYVENFHVHCNYYLIIAPLINGWLFLCKYFINVENSLSISLLKKTTVYILNVFSFIFTKQTGACVY